MKFEIKLRVRLNELAKFPTCMFCAKRRYLTFECGKMKTIIILACLCFSAALGTKPRPPKIEIGKRPNSELFVVGGNNAVPHAHPYQVSLQAPVSGGWYHFCGGSVISENKVVTAAHCIDVGFPISSLRVVAGDHDLYRIEGTEQASLWKSAVVHPLYSLETVDWDYAVITTVANFTYNEFVQPVFLAAEGTVHSGLCSATGWGYLNPQGQVPSILQQVNLPYVPTSTCNEIYSSANWEITDRMLCAGGELTKGVCSGDSGGALVCKGVRGDYLAGIASYVMPECAENNYPDGFANVAYGREWLLSN